MRAVRGFGASGDTAPPTELRVVSCVPRSPSRHVQGAATGDCNRPAPSDWQLVQGAAVHDVDVAVYIIRCVATFSS